MATDGADMRENPAPLQQKRRVDSWRKMISDTEHLVTKGNQYAVGVVAPLRLGRSQMDFPFWYGAYEVVQQTCPAVRAERFRFSAPAGDFEYDAAPVVGAARMAIGLTRGGVSIIGGKWLHCMVFRGEKDSSSYARTLSRVLGEQVTLFAAIEPVVFASTDHLWDDEQFGHSDGVRPETFTNTGAGEMFGETRRGRVVLRSWTGPMDKISRMAVAMLNEASSKDRKGWVSEGGVIYPVALFRGRVQLSEAEIVSSIMENTAKFRYVEDSQAKEKFKALAKRVIQEMRRGTYRGPDEYFDMGMAQDLFYDEVSFGGDMNGILKLDYNNLAGSRFVLALLRGMTPSHGHRVLS